ncbi:MAG: phosphoribosylformylglycinamidine cyclo-ligase [Candidatus Kapabacteria bacterium]|nr:phosphoribosylformylglycinamidine cyclo-ligase [Candidatus Kapabacteria bacterium]
MDYKSAGVSIEAGEELVDRIKPLVRSTFTPRVLTDIGLFGACFDARFPEYEHPVLVSSVDGVGTKLKIAFATGKHDTVGQCLVNHCVNDILVCGASPLYFMDYFATGKLAVGVAEQVISGFAKACRENGCALIGGETAEMPSMYEEGEYDVAGTIVGVVEKSKMQRGDTVQEGDVLLGLRSSGLHTNGYSLARKVLFPRFSAEQHFDDLGMTLGEALLAVHTSYLPVMKPILDHNNAQNLVHGMSHITGGGIIGNTKRVVPKHLKLDVDWSAWQLPPLFAMIQREGNIADEEMRHVFNLGIGYIIITPESSVDAVSAMLPEKPVVMGRVVKGA